MTCHLRNAAADELAIRRWNATQEYTPVDVDDVSAFPNIAAARRHLASLSPERRAQLDAEWNDA